MQKKTRKAVVILAAIMMLSVAGCGSNPADLVKGLPITSAGSSGTEEARNRELPDKPEESGVEDLSVMPEGNAKGEPSEGLEETSGGETFIKDFGSYMLPPGWVENEEFSNGQKFFYVVDDTEEEELPNHISVEAGYNRYAAEDHNQFKEAIMKQLAMQISGTEANLAGDGFTTDHNYITYQFTIEEEGNDMVTTQYYIIGDYRYVLVHETAKKDAAGADEAAEAIVNSFTWAE